MSTNREDLKRRSKALSTNARGFTASGKRFSNTREHVGDEDDEDVRLESYRRTKKVDALRSIASHESRGLKSQEIVEESPNGYVISGKAPPEIPRAIKYYSYYLRQFTVHDYPVEYGVIHYNLGKVFFSDRTHKTRDYEARAKSIENALHHFRLAVEVFDFDSYPVFFAVINIFIGQLFRERAMLITNRSILAKRGVTVADSCTIGLSQLMDASMTFSNTGTHLVENAICQVEIGWLYILQMTEAMVEDGSIDPSVRRKGKTKEVASEEQLMTYREYAITALEKGERMIDEVYQPPEQTRYGAKARARGWDPLDKETYPAYINLLIMDLSLDYVRGQIAYLSGRLYQEWDHGVDHQSQAYHHLKQSVKMHGLPPNCEQYIDAHHRIASILVNTPAVFTDDFHSDGMPLSDLCYVDAAKHLYAALKSPIIKPGRKMDIAFHLAQANIARFHIIVDRVKPNDSLVQALVANDGIEIMKDIERALREAMKGSTAANTQSTQDAFVYYYSSIKLSEFRTLQSGMDAGLPAASRLALLTQAFNLLVDALLSRSIIDNLDLHYIATMQMAQVLSSSRCFDSATMWFTKSLMCLTAMCNRVQNTPEAIRDACFRKIETEIGMQVERSIIASSKDIKWEKEHLGPLYLTESVTSGFAYWSFEEEFEKKPKEIAPPPAQPLTAAEAKAGRAPPQLIRPHMSDSEMEYANRQRLTGEGMKGANGAAPVGAVPLWAMNHHPEFKDLDGRIKEGRFGHTGSNQYSERNRAIVPEHIHKTLCTHVHILKNREYSQKSVSLMPTVSLKKKKKNMLEPRVTRPTLTKVGEKKLVRKPGLLGMLTGEMVEVDADLQPGQTNSADEETIDALPQIDYLSSKQCFCLFMTLSRLSRAALVLRSNNLRFNLGQRTRDILNNLSVNVGKRFFSITRDLKEASAHLVLPPTTIRELSRRSFADLKGVFRSNVEVARLLADYEEFLYTELAKEDYYLPMICGMPSFTRDICGVDGMLLNPDVMLDSIVQEAKRQAEVEREAEEADEKDIDAGVYVRDTASPDKDAWRARKGTSAAGVGANDAEKTTPLASEIPKKKSVSLKEKKKKEALNDLAYSLFQKLDGSGFLGGSRHMLSEMLNANEALFLWHFPAAAQEEQKVYLILIWRDESPNGVKRARRRWKIKEMKEKGTWNSETDHEWMHTKDIVMEVCKSEVTRAQLETLVRNYLKALHQASPARRITHSTKALRALSSYLSIGEILLMLPEHIEAITVCCPTFMRMIPWHLLLFEKHTEDFAKAGKSTMDLVAQGKLFKAVPKFSTEPDILEINKEQHQVGVEEYHLLEKYLVRMGPSLALFEVCSVTCERLGDDFGIYRMCAIDGEARSSRSPGLRATDHEVEVVVSTFSGDPDDVTVLQYDLASARQVATGKATHVSKAELTRRKAARDQKFKKREEKLRALEEDDDVRADDIESESDSDMSSDDEEAISNRKGLSMARVVHFAANRMPMQVEVDGNQAAMAAKGHHGVNFSKFGSVCLPQYVNRKGNFTEDKRRHLTAEDLVKQVNFRNCALAIMSRFGICDGALHMEVMEANVEYLEAMHMLGAATLIYPMQNTGDIGGLSTLASLCFLIRFYAELPTQSRERLSICQAWRRTMLWLKDQTAGEIISWLDTVPIPSKQREAMITEMEKYVDAASSGADYGDTEDLPHVDDGDEKDRPTDRKFFSHFLMWGNYVVSGAGGNVHPKNLTEDGEDVERDHLMYDTALHDIRMEIIMLREEGRFSEADQLAKRLTEMQIESAKEKYEKVKHYGKLASRGLGDVLEALDKALLDQDEDEINLDEEVSGDKEEEEKTDKSFFTPKKKREEVIDLWARGEIPTEPTRYVPLPDSLKKVGLDKLAETSTPVSMMTSYIESLFPQGSQEAEASWQKTKVKKLRAIKNEEELRNKEIAMKIAEDPDSFEKEIRDTKREEMVKSRQEKYAPMIEEINQKKEERLRLNRINTHTDNAIDHLNTQEDSAACVIT